MKVRFVEEAEIDLSYVWHACFVASGERRANELLERIRGTFDRTIGTFPESGRLRLEFGEGVRSFPILPYLVFYRVEPHRIAVLRILHGHRDLQPPLISLLIAG